MKGKKIAVVMLSLAVSITGCGHKEQESTASGAVIEKTDDVVNEETKVEKEISEEGLGGVYLNGGTIAEIKMGTCYEGVQTDFCTIKMPTEYMFGAIYTDESGQTHSIADTGSITLQEALEKGSVNEEDNAISAVYLYSFAEDKSSLSFYIDTTDYITMDDLKRNTPNGVEFGTDEHPAYCYINPDVYVDADLCIGYQVNDSILLSITYQGILVDELGLEQLAQNIYDLVEVIN